MVTWPWRRTAPGQPVGPSRRSYLDGGKLTGEGEPVEGSAAHVERVGCLGHGQKPSGLLEALGQYRANISGQVRRHVALPGRSLEFGRRFFRSF